MADDTPGVIDRVKTIGADATELLELARPKAAGGADLTAAEIKKIGQLVKRSEATMSEASERAKAARREQIAELESHIENLTMTLATPGLSRTARDDLKALRRNRRAQLLNLQTREALDFGGILTADQVAEIGSVLKRAKADVAQKKKAAAFLASLTKIADLSVSIVRKATVL